MGKRTTAAVAAIGKVMGECNGLVEMIEKCSEQSAKLRASNAVQIEIMDAVNEEYMPGGHRTPGSEKLVEEDKRNVAAVKILEANTKTLMNTLETINAAKKALQAKNKELSGELAVLEKLIADKLKKNPKDKTKYADSLALIDKTNKFLEATTKMAK